MTGMVTALDEAVGRVVAALKETGHYDNSIIVFTTDVCTVVIQVFSL